MHLLRNQLRPSLRDHLWQPWVHVAYGASGDSSVVVANSVLELELGSQFAHGLDIRGRVLHLRDKTHVLVLVLVDDWSCFADCK